ncbi:MAG: 50S ribosomal protein L5 [Candidatus Nanoarchaeia archaeon]
MREIKIEKITLNIGTGEPGEKLEKALKLLKNISGEKPVKTVTRKRIPTWKIRPGLQIGCKVTLRGEKAQKMLKRLLQAKGNKLKKENFDDKGNFAFGIKEYLDIPEAKYDADIGIIGLEVAVTLQRPGYRIKRRMIKPKKIPKKHAITKQEAIEFIQKKYGIEVEQ